VRLLCWSPRGRFCAGLCVRECESRVPGLVRSVEGGVDVAAFAFVRRCYLGVPVHIITMYMLPTLPVRVVCALVFVADTTSVALCALWRSCASRGSGPATCVAHAHAHAPRARTIGGRVARIRQVQ
jgi:hypothetical protein